MNIQPIPYGLNRNATSIFLEWESKEFYSNEVCLKINLLDESNNLIETICQKMETANYMALGATKEDRALAILTELGIEVLLPQELT